MKFPIFRTVANPLQAQKGGRKPTLLQPSLISPKQEATPFAWCSLHDKLGCPGSLVPLLSAFLYKHASEANPAVLCSDGVFCVCADSVRDRMSSFVSPSHVPATAAAFPTNSVEKLEGCAANGEPRPSKKAKKSRTGDRIPDSGQAKLPHASAVRQCLRDIERRNIRGN